MKSSMNILKLFVSNVSVDLGCRDVGVAEHFLDGSDVGAVAQ